MSWRTILATLLGVLVLAHGATAPAAGVDPRIAAGSADLVLLDGKVITVDPHDSIAEAVAVKDGRVLAVGSTRQISRWIGPKTQVLHLGGKSVLPGFIDAHTHVAAIASFQHTMLDVHIPPLKDVNAILQKLREAVSQKKPGEWIVGAGGWGQALPDREQMDAVAPNNPVVMRESAHRQFLNSMAMKIAGINKDTKPPAGGRIYRDKDGNPTGEIQEMGSVWASHVPPPTEAEMKTDIRRVLQQFRSLGVTTIYDYSSPETMRIYQQLREEGKLPVRLHENMGGKPGSPYLNFVLGLPPRFGDDWLRFGCIGELFIDGETTSAVRYDPPGQRKTWVGNLAYSQDVLNAVVMQIHEAGWQPCIHAIGDKAQDMLLEAYERAQKADPTPDPRYRMEHAGNQEAGPTTADQLKRMKRLGVIPVLTAAWINLPTGWDPVEAKVPYIYRTLRAEGFRTPGSSDSAGSQPASMSPFFSIWDMVTRKVSSGGVLAPQEAIPVAQAIRSYTMDSAYAGFEEKNRGSIEPGKLADLIVVSADPLTVPADDIKDIKVLKSIIGGQIVSYGTGPR